MINWYKHIHDDLLLKDIQYASNHFITKNSEESKKTKENIISYLTFTYHLPLESRKDIKDKIHLYYEQNSLNPNDIPPLLLNMDYSKYGVTSKNFKVSLIQVVNLDETYVPYLSEDYRRTFDFLNFATTLNKNNITIFPPKNNLKSKNYLKNYKFDFTESLLLRVPTFITSIFKYAMIPKSGNIFNFNKTISEVEIIDIELLLFSMDVLENYERDYDVSVYFEDDTFILKYINFIIKYNLFKRRITHRSANIYKEAIENGSPCSISNLTDYYEKVVKGYDCLSEVCSILNCKQDEFLYENYYVNPNKYYYLPNCLCAPLFCFDHKTSDVPDDILPLYNHFKNLNEENFANVYDVVTTNIQLSSLNFLKVNTILFRDTCYLKEVNGQTTTTCLIPSISSSCRFRFTRAKIGETGYPYKIDTENFVTKYDSDLIVTRLYFYEEMTLENLVSKFKEELSWLKTAILIVYGFIIIIMGIVFTKWLNSNVADFKNRIDEMRGIHKLIINNEEKTQNKQSLLSKTHIIAKSMTLSNRDNNSVFHDGKSKKTNQANVKNTGEHIINNDQDEFDDTDSDEEVDTNKEIHEQELREKHERELANKFEESEEFSENENYNNPMIIEGSRFKDELQEIYSIIIDNIKDFTLEFEIDRNVYIEDGFVKRYIKYINKRQYTDFLLPPKQKVDVSINSMNENNEEEYSESDEANKLGDSFKVSKFQLNNSNSINKVKNTNNNSFQSRNNQTVSSNTEERIVSEIEKRDLKTDLSVSILYEIISCEFLHMNHYYKNFYYREMFQEKLIDLEEYINKCLYNDQGTNNEMSNADKVIKAMNFFSIEIILRWKNLFEKNNEI